MKRYDSYKDSGIEWIGQMPDHWGISKIKFLFDIQKGKTPKNLLEKLDVDTQVYLAMDYLRGEPKQTFFVSREENVVEVDEGDTLLLWDGSNAGEFLKSKKGALSSTMAVIKSNIIDFGFQWYSFKNYESILKDSCNGMGIPHVDGKFFRGSAFAIPPIEEQTTIANYLDQKTTQIDDLIAKKERLIQLLEEERTAIINELVTGKKVWNGHAWTEPAEVKDSGIEWLGEIPAHWSYSSLKWYSKIYSGGTPSKDVEEYWLNGTIPWLNSGCVNQWDITEVSDYITEEAFNNSSAKWIPNKSLVIALAGQGKTKGMVAQVQFETTCNQSMGVIVPNEKIYNRFLQYWLKNNYQNIRSLGGGDKRDGLNLVMIGGIPIPVLPLNEQEKIANYLDSMNLEIDSIKAKTEQEIELLKEYKTALISEVVTGKVDVSTALNASVRNEKLS